MSVLYRGRDIRVTLDAIESHHPVHHRIAIRDLRDPHIVEVPAPPPAAVQLVRSGSTGMAGVNAVAGALAWSGASPAAGVPASALLVLVFAVSVAVSGACWRVHPVERALIATCRGQEICLFRTLDAREFGQVKRALVRALEHAADAQ